MHTRPNNSTYVYYMYDCQKVYQMFYFDMTCNAKQRKVTYHRVWMEKRCFYSAKNKCKRKGWMEGIKVEKKQLKQTKDDT